MTIKFENLSHIQVKETLSGREEKVLVIDCSECSGTLEHSFQNGECILCVLKNLYLNRKKGFKNLTTKTHNPLIEQNQISLFLNYFKKINYIKKIWKKIDSIGKKKCLYQEFNCKITALPPKFLSFSDDLILNPLYVFNFISEKIIELKDHEYFNIECQNCSKNVLVLLEALLNVLNELKIIQSYKRFLKSNNNSKDLNKFYEEFFFKKSLFFEEKKSFDKALIVSTGDLFEKYKTGDNEIFQISIYNIANEYEKKYSVQYSFESVVDENYFKKVVQDVKNNLKLIDLNKIAPLENLISIYKKEALIYLDSKYKFPLIERERIAYVAALYKLNLEKIFPLLIDDFIEEIFLDSPNDKIYINHQKFGRCRTDIKLKLKEIERLKTFLRIYSGKRLDYSNPSIKVVIKNKYFYCRFAIDVEPIQLNHFALDIRKLNKNILTVQDLLKNGTLNPAIAAFLYLSLIRRVNITVTGVTDTGKTTLINALDLLTPKKFRKIYVENVIESLNQSKYERHQLKYKVDSLQIGLNHKLSKQNQIRNLLHRTPDIIYLGEILTKEEAEAMFHCLAAGLKGFQTIHSNDIASLINRIVHHFKIHISCLSDLGLIVFMKKNREKRFVDSISEINNNIEDNKEIYQTLFKFNPQKKNWANLINLFNSNIICKLRKYEDISEEKFQVLFNLYKDMFNTLQKIDKLSINKLIKFFDQVSFHSSDNLENLCLFWENWKNSCSLNL
jgi:Flp pilus assembly CpaF family ATPase